MFKRNKKKTEQVRNPRLMEGQEEYSFRRSRTLTGSVSSDVSSAAEDRSHLKSPRIKLHRLRKHRRGLVAGILATLACAVALGWLLSQYIRNPEASIRYTQHTIQEQADKKAYSQAIEEYFVKRPMDRFAFQLDHEQLVVFLQSKHPEIESVTASASVDGTQDIALTFRKPILSWNTDGTLLFIDANGVAFGKNYFDNPSVSVEDKTGIEFTEAEVVVSDRFMSFLGRMVGYINQGKVGQVSKVIIPADTLRQVDVQLKGKGYIIKTHIDRDPYQQAEDVINAVKHIEKQGIKPKYVDVRVEGRAFYRE